MIEIKRLSEDEIEFYVNAVLEIGGEMIKPHIIDNHMICNEDKKRILIEITKRLKKENKK